MKFLGNKYQLTNYGQKLVSENIGLVGLVIKTYYDKMQLGYTYPLSLDEMYSSGYVGLIHAVAKAKPNKHKAQWVVYAKNCINSQIINDLRAAKIIQIPHYLTYDAEHRYKTDSEKASVVHNLENCDLLDDNDPFEILLKNEETISEEIKYKEILESANPNEKLIIELRLKGLSHRRIALDSNLEVGYVYRTLKKIKIKWPNMCLPNLDNN